MIGALAPGQIARRDGALIDYLDPVLRQRGSTLDHAQSAALDRLQALCDELAEFKAARKSTLKRLLSPPDIPRGVYLYGGVGRGKSFLMDSFYAVVPIRRKTRVHFHAFMRDVHEELRTLKHEVDPLVTVAARIARRYRLICFDEFHVSDIADAMILGRLLTALFDLGVVFVMTSNYRPDALWPNGLLRERFLPAIALIERHCAIVQLLAAQDYRLRELSRAGVYFTPLGDAAEQALDACFEHVAPGARRPESQIVVNGRGIPVKRRAEGVIWFDFAALCEGPRSVADYIELAQSFNTVLISGVPALSPQMEDAARRFVNLIDEFYDHGVNLVVSAAAAPAGLYRGERLRAEFARTQSRLTEMQSAEYLARAHRQ